MPNLPQQLLLILLFPTFLPAQETHNHPAPEKLGTVSFPISCKPSVQDQFNRGVALLHSFAYTEADASFQNVAKLDSQCAISVAHCAVSITAMVMWRHAFRSAVARYELRNEFNRA